MSERLLLPIQNANNNPRLEFRDGQFLFASMNQEGAHIERLISPEAVRESFTGIPIDSGWLRPEIVRWGTGRIGEWAIAFIPPQVHELEMTKETATDTGWKLETELDRVRTPLPGLVLFGLSNQYHIWAVKTDHLDPYHEIYRCPLPNVEETGLICWGPFKPPRCTAKSIFDAFELFIKSTFNNHRCNGKSKSQRDDVRLLLRELSAKPQRQDPMPPESCVVCSADLLPLTDEPPHCVDCHVTDEIREEWDAAAPPSYPVQDLMRQVDHTGITLDQQIRAFFEPVEAAGMAVLTEDNQE